GLTLLIGVIELVVVNAQRRRMVAIWPDLSARLAAYGPRFILHWSAPEQSEYQLKMWAPYLARIGHPFAVFTRTLPAYEAAKREIEGVPVFLLVDQWR